MVSRTLSESVILTRTRRSIGIDQELMGTYLGLSKQMISMIERGNRSLKLKDEIALLTLDIWMNPSVVPGTEGTQNAHELATSQAAKWLSAQKSLAKARLVLKQHELREMISAYDRSREVINRLKGTPPSSALKPLPTRWVQRVVKVHERVMENCGPQAHMKLQVAIAVL